MVLIGFDSVDDTSLRWLRQNEKPVQFDLLAGDATLATLTWEGGSGSLAIARTAQGTWTLKRVGFLTPRVSVRAEGAAADVARLSVHFNYHRIEMTRGPAYRFHRAGILLPAWQVARENGSEILHIEPVREGRTLVGGAVIASAAAAHLPDLPLLAILSWYFIVLAWFEDEAIVPLEGPDAPTSPAR